MVWSAQYWSPKPTAPQQQLSSPSKLYWPFTPTPIKPTQRPSPQKPSPQRPLPQQLTPRLQLPLALNPYLSHHNNSTPRRNNLTCKAGARHKNKLDDLIERGLALRPHKETPAEKMRREKRAAELVAGWMRIKKIHMRQMERRKLRELKEQQPTHNKQNSWWGQWISIKIKFGVIWLLFEWLRVSSCWIVTF